MFRRLAIAVFAFGFAELSAQPAATQDLSGTPASPTAVALARVVSSVPKGSAWAELQSRWPFCMRSSHKNLLWNGVVGDISVKPYIAPLSAALQKAGFVAADDPENLFQKERGASDLAVAMNIKDVKASFCAPGRASKLPSAGHIRFDDDGNFFVDIDEVSGAMTVTADWQLYSRSRDKILDKQQIVTVYEIKDHAQGNLDRFAQQGVEENIRAYIGSAGFRAAVASGSTAQSFQPDGQPKLTLPVSHAIKPVSISDAVGSVVLIQSAGGHGSGFLVSLDGYVITAQHVVGRDRYVKVRWSDGLEGVGEVIRADSRRDVAILKVDPRGRQPLGLHLLVPAPGDTVFAIGAPIDPKLQSTVTRGVASANRIIDGFSFIQSDVTVDPGNSGGPLLNENGEVLGFTDIGFRTKEAPTGLNFFVPIDDALRFLSAEPR